MDNFPSFTELGQLPDWYEGEDAGRALAAGAAGRRWNKNGRKQGSLREFHASAQLHPGSRPSASGNESAENWEKLERSLGVCAPGAGRLAARISVLEPREIYVWGVWEFERSLTKSRSLSGPS